MTVLVPSSMVQTIVLRVDIHAMRHREGVGISSDLAHERAVLIELEQLRSVSATGEDVHLPSELRAIPIVSPNSRPAGIFRKFGSDFHGICGAVGDASAWRQLPPSAETGLRTALGRAPCTATGPSARLRLLGASVRKHHQPDAADAEASPHTHLRRMRQSNGARLYPPGVIRPRPSQIVGLRARAPRWLPHALTCSCARPRIRGCFSIFSNRVVVPGHSIAFVHQRCADVSMAAVSHGQSKLDEQVAEKLKLSKAEMSQLQGTRRPRGRRRSSGKEPAPADSKLLFRIISFNRLTTSSSRMCWRSEQGNSRRFLWRCTSGPSERAPRRVRTRRLPTSISPMPRLTSPGQDSVQFSRANSLVAGRVRFSSAAHWSCLRVTSTSPSP